MKIIAATQNKHKLTELSTITESFGMSLCSMKDAGLGDLEIEENGSTFEENSLIKAQAITERLHLPAIADDSGLMVDALDGAPGVYSARFSGVHGDDAANRRRVLELLRDVPDDRRGAGFVCVITLLQPDGSKIVAKGVCRGRIAREERGTGGFGYDSIFIPEGQTLTFAQLGTDVKNVIGHRARALAILKKELEK